jgi:hypothetical protein
VLDMRLGWRKGELLKNFYVKSKSLRKSLATSVIFVDITEMCVKEICQG